jgi:hypothetical protein
VAIADEGHADQAGVDVEAVQAHGVVVVPESGGVLLHGVAAGVGGAGDEPVFGVAVVLGGSLGAVEMDTGSDLGEIAAAAVEGEIDGKEVPGGEVVDPLDLEGLAGAGFDEWGERGGGASRRSEVVVGPMAAGREVAMDLGMDLAHADAEPLWAGVVAGGDGLGALGQREGIDKRGEFQSVEHGDPRRLGGCGRGRCRHVVVHHLLGEGGNGAGEQAEGGGLLQKAAAGGRQAVGSEKIERSKELGREKGTHSEVSGVRACKGKVRV